MRGCKRGWAGVRVLLPRIHRASAPGDYDILMVPTLEEGKLRPER